MTSLRLWLIERLVWLIAVLIPKQFKEAFWEGYKGVKRPKKDEDSGEST